MSFVKKLRTERGATLYFISCTVGLKYYAFVLIPNAEMDNFEKVVRSDTFDLKAHGTIVSFCLGESEMPKEMSKEVQDYIRFLTKT